MPRMKALFLTTLLLGSSLAVFTSDASPAAAKPAIAAGAQYTATHVYVAPEDFDRLVGSLIATFGGVKSTRKVIRATPAASQAIAQFVFTPVGSFAVFGYKTPTPYPFGTERMGCLVTDMDTATAAAKKSGAALEVSVFPGSSDRNAMIEWPGGLHMELHWNASAPTYSDLQTAPENHVYIPPERVEPFVKAIVEFAEGKVLSDDKQAPGVEVGRPNDPYRRVRIEASFGKIAVISTDGQLPYPYGYEAAGYEVTDLAGTLEKAEAAGATILVKPYIADQRRIAIVQFPGGYIAEIHASTRN